MSPVPTDPNPDFVPGTTINADQVDARFLELYKALDPTRVGIDISNLAASLVQLLHSAGDIKASARGIPETGWLVCDGSAVSRTTYSALFAAIGTTYGVGDGATTFNLPDLRGRVPVGEDGTAGRQSANDARGQSGGAQTKAIGYPNLPAVLTSGASGGTAFASGASGTAFSITLNGAGAPLDVMPPYQVVNFFIKT